MLECGLSKRTRGIVYNPRFSLPPGENGERKSKGAGVVGYFPLPLFYFLVGLANWLVLFYVRVNRVRNFFGWLGVKEGFVPGLKCDGYYWFSVRAGQTPPFFRIGFFQGIRT